MTIVDSLTKTQNPSAADRAFVAQIISEVGLRRASLKLGISRIATMQAASGGACYSKTLAAIKAAREAA